MKILDQVLALLILTVLWGHQHHGAGEGPRGSSLMAPGSFKGNKVSLPFCGEELGKAWRDLEAVKALIVKNQISFET